jgi:dGTP triphosphohydrolase
LLEDDSSFSQLLELYKNVAMRHVFSHPDVEQLELQGYRVISGLLEIYRPLLQLSVNEFSELVEQERVRRLPIESRLYQNFLPAIAWLMLKQSADWIDNHLNGLLWNIILVAVLFRTISAA